MIMKDLPPFLTLLKQARWGLVSPQWCITRERWGSLRSPPTYGFIACREMQLKRYRNRIDFR